jgi:predicted unusual protein kinase regulating ubiquinone biosynthesis (AarF/ABC1/UbiB family)
VTALRRSTEPSGIRVTLRAVRRSLVVLAAFLPLVFALARDRRRLLLVGGPRRVDDDTRRARSVALRATLVDLGPTFIKFGQILSTRPDVLPGPYVEELGELQDRVPPAPWERVRPTVEDAVGDVEETFDEFDTEPISGASLGQVYVAERDGQRVAVKVLRPGIRPRVEGDLRVVSTFLPWLVRFAPPGQAFTLENLGEEFASTIRKEMNYAREAESLREVRTAFEDDPKVVVPAVYDDLSTDRVIVMEYVDGVKVDDPARVEELGVDPSGLVRRIEEAYITMIIEEGTFHADPHPGNLAVQADGSVVFYDFGMTGRLGQRTRDELLDVYVAVARDDVEAVLDAFVTIGALDPAADRELMRQTFEVVIEHFRGRDVDTYRISEIVSAFEAQLYDFPMRLPQNLALVVRVSTVLEGVCRTLDPDFDFIAVVTDYVMDEGTSDESKRRVASEVAEGAVRQVRDTVTGAAAVPPTLSTVLDRLQREDVTVTVRIDDDNGELRRLARRLALAALAGANTLSVVLVYAFDGPRVAGPLALGLPVLGFALYRSFGKRRGIRAKPKFTRLEMRKRGGS